MTMKAFESIVTTVSSIERLIERGWRVPSLRTLHTVTVGFGISPSDLLRGVSLTGLCLLVVLAFAWFLLQRKGKAMSEMPIGVGDAEAQKQFLRKYEAFLKEHGEVRALLTKTFIRRLASSSTEQGEEIDDTSLDKRMADVVVFYLGRIAADDFGELLVLCGNGRGIGAYKILRGMYERVVTAGFIAKNPSEARLFLSHSFIEREKLWNRLKKIVPNTEDKRTPEQVKEFEYECQEARGNLKSSICKRCNQPITQEAWTRKSLEEMAEKTDGNLAVSYSYCYVIPTFHLHATAYGREARIQKTETGFTYKETSEEEARKALLYGHGLVLRLLKLQNNYFNLGLDDEIETRWNAFPTIWKGHAADESPDTI